MDKFDPESQTRMIKKFRGLAVGFQSAIKMAILDVYEEASKFDENLKESIAKSTAEVIEKAKKID